MSVVCLRDVLKALCFPHAEDFHLQSPELLPSSIFPRAGRCAFSTHPGGKAQAHGACKVGKGTNNPMTAQDLFLKRPIGRVLQCKEPEAAAH